MVYFLTDSVGSQLPLRPRKTAKRTPKHQNAFVLAAKQFAGINCRGTNGPRKFRVPNCWGSIARHGYLRAKIKRFGGIGNTEVGQELQFYKQKNADREFFS